MTQYLISFSAHAMDYLPDEDMAAVGKAAQAVVQEAVNTGVFVCAGGLEDQRASIVAIDGTVTEGPYPEVIGGLTVIDVPSRPAPSNGTVRCQNCPNTWSEYSVVVMTVATASTDWPVSGSQSAKSS